MSVVHGDYRLDNMIFAADKPQVIAVLDWELSTLGDPLADFTYLLMQWIMSSGGGRTGLVGADLPALNIPTLEEAVEIYCKATGRPNIPDLNWYFSYNLFRLTGILQGIAGRIRDGTASSARGVRKRRARRAAGEGSWEYAVKAGAARLCYARGEALALGVDLACYRRGPGFPLGHEGATSVKSLDRLCAELAVSGGAHPQQVAA